MGLDLHMVVTPATTPPGYHAQYQDQPGYFRINAGAVPMMIGLLTAAGVMTDEKAPTLPGWPPAGLSKERAERAQVIDEKGGAIRPFLDEREAAIWSRYKQGLESGLAARSRTKGKVPGFKLATSDGWLVAPDEARSIATAAERYARALTQAELDRFLVPFERQRRELIAAMKARQGFVPIGLDGPPPSLQQIRDWLVAFARYNALAVDHGGYRVR